MKTSRLWLWTAAGAAALAGLSTVALATHSWGGYHWARDTDTFTLKIVDNTTTSSWKLRLGQAIGDWNDPSSPIFLASVTGGNNKNCRMASGTVQVCNGAYGRNGWLGLASINITGGVHITQGSSKMNDTYFNMSTYNNVNERQHVMCQEVAHTFGLDHQSEDGSSQNSCMDYFSNTGANATSDLSTKPNAHDFQELNIIYGHLDSFTTVAPLSAAAPKANPSQTGVDIDDNPNSWGLLMRQSAKGRNSSYERTNRDGSITVTHVYWTQEAADVCPACDHRYHDDH